ncbi:MAG TPA: EF-hand domain-containing protein [Burkholderiales bacterium]|nr:EF-hand domain-containing protein [Burkholderiales bacterium]
MKLPLSFLSMAGAVAIALAASPAFAAQQAKERTAVGTVGAETRSSDSGFARLDRNNDGYISKAESVRDPALKKDFAKFDLNHDGKLNRAEYLAAGAKEDISSLVHKVTGKEKASSSTGSSAK